MSDADRAHIAEVVAQAASSGRTHWLAQVVHLESAKGASGARDAGLRCLAAAGTQDRFYWEDVASGDYYAAWGVADEVEAAGRARFADVSRWSKSASERLCWIGEVRPSDAPVFLGGFGFEEEGARSPDWKGFPAARFVLPEILLECVGGLQRAVFVVRVEPGVTAEGVEALLHLRAETLQTARIAEPETPLRGRPPAMPDPMEAIGFEAGEGAGPEYRVRSDRSQAVFEGQVAQALAAIDAEDFEKVVLARSLRVDHDGEVDVPAFLGRLRGLYPTCTLLAVGRGEDTFLAATPEALVKVEGRAVSTAALAGSAPRGREPEEDERLAASLTGSAKERAEHAHVVDAIREVLAPLCSELDAPTSPSLRQLFGIQHLETNILGRLRDVEDESASQAPDLLGIAAALHPTPAVGGAPSLPAREWLRRFEGLDRGWYAAPVGWLDAEGGGNLRVALRSGLVRNGLVEGDAAPASRTLLFAGAGIVAGSEPQAELVETRIKLRALLAPLTEI
ncbi:MAG: isochorismate synthase MenF [Myxococcota bacterium]